MKDSDESRMDRVRKKWTSFSRKFKLDSHHAIERFSVATVSFVVAGGLVIGGGMVSAHKNGQADLTTVAQYTSEFVSSRTGVGGDVTGVFGNADKTRSLVMMKFDNPSDMSTNPNDYEVHVTGIDGGPNGGASNVGQATVGSVVNFGSTGYLGVFLEAPEGFSEQLLNLTVRANNEIATNTRSKPMDTEGLDPSFTKYDQWRVIVNPVASEVTHLEALDSEGPPEVRSLYTQAVLRPDEQEVRTELNDTLAQMRTQLERIRSYEASMSTTAVRIGRDENVRLVPPVLPDEITGDDVSGLSATELSDALQTTPVDQIEGLENKSALARDMDDSMPELNTYRLQNQKVIPGGFNFNWRDRTIEEGYLSEVVPSNEDPFDYVSKISGTQYDRKTARDLEWPLTNGTLLSDHGVSDASVKPLTDLRNNAVQAYDKYFQLKQKYQTVLLQNLLVMEIDVDSVVNNSDVVTGTDAVTFRT